jgi:hypothetical protein
MQSLRAIEFRLHQTFRRAMFHATNRGSNVGNHIAKKTTRPAESWSLLARIDWAIA